MKPLRDRFLERVEKTDGCWLWQGFIEPAGYGSFRYGTRKQGRTVRAHRLSYEIHVGPIPPGMFVCHRCDNKRCVNPAHLFPGTRRENVDDMLKKNRQASGERHGQTPLTERDVILIRKLASSLPHRVMAKRFGVSKGTISNITLGKTWKRTGVVQGKTTASDEMKAMLLAGAMQRELSEA